MEKPVCLTAPLSDEQILPLRAGQKVTLSGYIYTARDKAHRLLAEDLKAGRPLPFPLKDQIIYYCGPSPAKEGAVIGSAGPTTSCRMDIYTPELLMQGLRGMIGKGPRSNEVRQAIAAHSAVYFAALGGAGAFLASHIKSNETVAYSELGTEAVRRLYVDNMPLIVINSAIGDDFYLIRKSNTKN